MTSNTHPVAPSIKDLPERQLEDLAGHDIPLSVLKSLCDPFACWIEQPRKITRQEVRECIKAGTAELCSTPTWSEILFGKERITPEENRERHIRKIAWFVLNPIEDTIHLEVGCANLGCLAPSHIVEDGNHRLAAAMMKGQETIRAKIGGGVEDAKQMGLWYPNEALQELEDRWENRARRKSAPSH